MEYKARDVDNYLRRPDPAHRVYLLYGPDRGLVAERGKRLVTWTDIDPDDPFAASRIEGADLEERPQRLREEAFQMSLTGGERLVWIRQMSAAAPVVEALADCMGDDLGAVRIIIEAGELAKSSALRKLAEKAPNAAALPCYGDDAKTLDSLIDAVMGEHGLRVDLEARRLITSLLGGDRIASRNELEKLALYARGEGTVTARTVSEILGDVSKHTFDRVLDAMLAGDLRTLETAYAGLLAEKLPANVLLLAGLRLFEQLATLVALVEQGAGQARHVVERARPPIFFSRRKVFEDAVRALDGKTCLRLQERLLHAQLQSRRQPALEAEIVRQALMASALEIRRAGRSAFTPA